MSKILRLFSGIRPQFLAVFAVLFACVFMFVGHQTAYATGPGVINFQGKVVNADGTNVTNGAYNFDFVMYDDAALGTPSDGVHDKWHELTKSVTVTNGVFQTNLGSATALPNFNTNPGLYLAVRFNADAAGYMTPRVQMTSVPYALNADNLGGINSSGYTQLSPSSQQTGSINISGNITAAGAGNNSFTGSLQSAAYLLGNDLSLQPVAYGQSVVTSWWGLQLVGNKQSTVTYTPANIGTAGQYGVIIPAQQAGAVAMLLQGAASQTGDLLQIQDSTGAVLAKVDASGSLTANGGLISNGTNTFNGDTTLNAQHHLQFADSDSSNWVAFQAPATVASNVTWTLPAADSAGCFKSDGSGNMSISTCGDVKTETISSTSTWNKPAGAIVEIVELWGGGGSGGAGQAAAVVFAAKLGGGAGGGGAYNTASFNAANIGGSVPITIGAGATGGTGVANGNGNPGSGGGQTCFSTTTGCGGTMYITAYGGGGGAATGTGNGGGGGGGIQGVGQSTTTTAAGTGGAPTATAVSTANNGFGGAGGAVAANPVVTAGAGAFGGGGGGASSTTAASNSGAGGGSNHGGGGGGGGGGCATGGCTIRYGGGGGIAGSSSASLAGGLTGGAAGTAGATGIGFGGGGGNGGASNNVTGGSTGGVGGAGGTQGGGGGGGGAAMSSSGTSTGGAGGAGGRGEVRITTIKGTGADLAEIYSTKDSSIGPGDVVSLDSSLKAGVQKSSKSYDSTAFGIISTTPSLVMGSLEDAGATPVMVALAGRVPIKVNLQNGPIKPGDFLTPSSTPGVAMKATKAGQIIAQAMIGYDGTVGANADNSSLIVAFVKNQVGNGSTLSDLVTGMSTVDDGSSAPDMSKLALVTLMTQKDALAATTDLSEITTDRVTAGLEVITPSVITDALTTNSIGSSGGGDITFLLNDTNKLVVKGKAGGEAFSVDATGNAVFGVSLVSLGSIESRGGLTVDGDALFNGKSTFAKLAQFQSDIDAQGRVTFNKDAGGTALITKGGTRVDVVFDKPYDHPPIVSITLLADQVTLPDGTVEDSKLKEQRLFDAGYSYLVSNSSAKGFTIVLNRRAAENLQFNWNAVAIKDPGTTTGQVDNTDTTNDQSASAEGQP